MKLLSFLLTFLAFNSASTSNSTNEELLTTDNRVYGGRDGSDGQFPYVAYHLTQIMPGSFSSCTAGIIGPRWVLTAAHCIVPGITPLQHIVAAGKADMNNYLRARRNSFTFHVNLNEATYGVQERRVEAIFYNPEFNLYGKGRDIGLMKLQRPFVFNNRVSAMPISRRAFEPSVDCVITGYGLSENNVRKNIIQYVTGAYAVPSQLCQYGKTRDAICLGHTNRGICKGDSGGPLVCGNSVVGVASLTIGNSQQGCGKGVREQHYTDVQKNLYWIDRILPSN